MQKFLICLIIFNIIIFSSILYGADRTLTDESISTNVTSLVEGETLSVTISYSISNGRSVGSHDVGLMDVNSANTISNTCGSLFRVTSIDLSSCSLCVDDGDGSVQISDDGGTNPIVTWVLEACVGSSSFSPVDLISYDAGCVGPCTLNGPSSGSIVIQDPSPVITSITLDDGDNSIANQIDLTPATTTQVNCSAIVSDANSASDLDSAWATIYHQDVGNSASDNPINHYTNNTCFIDTNYGLTNEAEIFCSFPVQFYASPGLWECNISVNDSTNRNDNGLDTSTINSLLAIDVTDGSILFDSLKRDDDSGTLDYMKTITNNGNVAIDISINTFGSVLNDGYSFSCTVGSIDDSNLRYSLSPSIDYYSKTSIISDAQIGTLVSDFNLNPQTTGTIGTSKSIYFGIATSSQTELGGDCSGNIMFTGVQN